jgi:hypothetical protein
VDALLVLRLVLGATGSEFGLSELALDLVVLFRVIAVVTPMDCVREWAAGPVRCVGCVETAGLRRDCDRDKPTVCGSDSLLTEAGGRMGCRAGASIPCSAGLDGAIPV